MTGVKVTGFKRDNSGAVKTVDDRPGRHRLRLCHRRRRPLGEADLGHAGAARKPSDQGPRRQGARQRADVGLLEPAGGHARRRSQAAAHQRRQDAAGDPCRYRCAAAIPMSTARSSPTSSGASTTSPTSISAACRAAPCPTRSRRRSTRSRSIPTGRKSPDFIVGDDFAHMWCSALAFCQKRFHGQMPHYKKEPSGGIGCFTADSFPVFDRFCDNVYCHRRLQPRLQDDRRRQAGGRGHRGQGKRAAASRSASRASPRASCIRSPTARSRGVERDGRGLDAIA